VANETSHRICFIQIPTTARTLVKELHLVSFPSPWTIIGPKSFLNLARLAPAMSADLLAEFGQSKPKAIEGGKKSTEVSCMLSEDNKSVFPDFSTLFRNTIPTAKTQGRAERLWREEDDGSAVLFDASIDKYEVEDEFGDFEDGKPEMIIELPADLVQNPAPIKTPPAASEKSRNLLDLEEGTGTFSSSNDGDLKSLDIKWRPFFTPPSGEVPDPQIVTISTAPSRDEGASVSGEQEETDEWEPFEDGQVSIVTRPTHDTRDLTSRAINGGAILPNRHIQDIRSTQRDPAPPSEAETRPTNIPPPTVLLQLLPKVFSKVVEMNFTPGSTYCCNAILQVFTVATYLIAGRNVRWKRDNILSQNNKIGPAAGGRKGGGMKLAAIDKSESLKEEREIAEVLQAWETHAHLFNATIHRVGIRRSLMTLSEKSRPHPAKGAEVLTSQYACALCGLKREERVPEANIKVDDSFGEFWIEYWGHRDCKDFWQSNQSLLLQR
jgi:hypothetical protein